MHKHTLRWKIVTLCKTLLVLYTFVLSHVIHAVSHLANYITLTWWQISWIYNSAEYQCTKMDVQAQWMQNFVTAQQLLKKANYSLVNWFKTALHWPSLLLGHAVTLTCRPQLFCITSNFGLQVQKHLAMQMGIFHSLLFYIHLISIT